MVTISYDDALRDRIREHLAGHDRRVVTDPTKRHAAVAVVLVDSIVGEDRVDPAPLDDWIDGEELLEPGLDTRPRMPTSSSISRNAASTAVSPGSNLPGKPIGRHAKRAEKPCGT